MAAPSISHSLKEYLKKYQSGADDPKKAKKKKKKEKPKHQSAAAAGVLVVDEDPVWQKPVHPVDAGEEDDSAGEEMPQIEEDIEVKRMKRLEVLRSRKPYHEISEDGSGWVSIPSKPSATTTDALGPLPQQTLNNSGNADLLPPRQQRQRLFESPVAADPVDEDLSPPRQRQRRLDSPSPEPLSKGSCGDADDLSPPRRRQHAGDLSHPRRSQHRMQEVEAGPASPRADLSPPRRARKGLSPRRVRGSSAPDLSPPRRTSKESRNYLSPPSRARKQSLELTEGRNFPVPNLSPTRRKEPSLSKEDARKGGLLSAKEMREEIDKKKKEERSRFASMDPSLTGRGAEAVHRDKEGKRISKEDLIKSKETNKEEKPLEWGKGLAQKRDAEERVKELELEMERPFARSRDDPELDKMLKDRIRWGDPMAHVVKQKTLEPILEDLGQHEKMKESGFIIPQTIPSHSWLKRRLDFLPNRYGIRPGRHWDGVDRSNGYEKQLFKRQNEKLATESEAYLWSVSDM